MPDRLSPLNALVIVLDLRHGISSLFYGDRKSFINRDQIWIAIISSNLKVIGLQFVRCLPFNPAH